MINHGFEQAHNNDTLVDRIKGTIYGQAIGDALGLGTEGMTDEEMALKYPNGITHYGDIFQDHHRKRWKIGDWTDDTDMMLCIANAVIKDKGVNITSIAQNFKHWADGCPMGIGETTHKVLLFGDYVVLPYKPNISLIHSILYYKLFAYICKFLYLYIIILADIYA